ncbi:pilS cassette [Neisseria gonorrhoeae]|nr:pilS cassette [Neisseria gonorrhoeae]MBT8020368.1 pilS cassette [Neisseria gonorrhoeae]MCQ3831738.1 pilS cassette [Neisseria gonorrhoeae]MCQ3833833.1 pilS cassette [Neisseria gonorrhoeae]PAX25636.1 pilS cassette [Neisseria gonorrhoeae]
MSTVFIESIESAPFDNPVYATEPSFPRKWESRTWGLGNCFYPISFCADSSGFPPARE